MKISIKVFLVLFLLNGEFDICHAGLGPGVGQMYDLVKLTAPTLLNSLNDLKANAEIPLSVLKDVQAFGNGVTQIVNNVIFHGERGMKPAFDIMSDLKGIPTTPASIFSLHVYIQSASFVGYTVYQMYHLKKMSSDFQSISLELRKIEQATQELDDIILKIERILTNIKQKLSNIQISSMEELDVLEKYLTEAFHLAINAKRKINHILRDLFKQISVTKSIAIDSNFRFGSTMAVAVGAGAGYLMIGALAPIAIPVGIVASLSAVRFKNNEVEANRFVSVLQQLQLKVRKRETELARKEADIEDLQLEIRLAKAKIQEQIRLDDAKVKEQIRLEEAKVKEQIRLEAAEVKKQIRQEKAKAEERIRQEKAKAEEQIRRQKAKAEEQIRLEKVKGEEDNLLEITKINGQIQVAREEILMKISSMLLLVFCIYIAVVRIR